MFSYSLYVSKFNEVLTYKLTNIKNKTLVSNKFKLSSG